MAPWLPAVHAVHEALERVQMSAQVSHGGGHEPEESSVSGGDDGGGIVREPDGVVRPSTGQVLQHRQVFLHQAR